MKILAIMGSPRKNGDNDVIVNKFAEGAESAGHEVEYCRVYDMNIQGCTGCMSCKSGKVDICIHNDDFIEVFNKIVAADCLLFSSPVYFGHMTGPLKTFIDRLFTFVKQDFSIRILPGKKYITVVTSGAPEELYCQNLKQYFKNWLGDFFKLEHAGSLAAGNLTKDGEIQNKTEILQQAKELGYCIT